MYVYVMYRVCHVQYMYAQYTAEDWGFFLFFTIFTFYLYGAVSWGWDVLVFDSRLWWHFSFQQHLYDLTRY